NGQWVMADGSRGVRWTLGLGLSALTDLAFYARNEIRELRESIVVSFCQRLSFLARQLLDGHCVAHMRHRFPSFPTAPIQGLKVFRAVLE
ncbi:MAG: hypothetical protein NTZ28_00135, partial [Nitrospirae bacterium]|nr:hypothetical protein [Nitrospirota bacterium]